MKTRHQPPSLVSMWMLDVFCCALGCVTLLWLLSTREAKDTADRNRAAVDLLARTDSELREVRLAAARDADRASAERAALARQLAAAEEGRDALAARLATADAALAGTRAQLTQAAADTAKLTTQADAQAAAVADLSAKLAGATQAADGLAKQLRAKDAERAAAAARLADADRMMADASKDKQATGDTLRQTRDELAATRATLIDLQGQKAKLADKLDKLQADADARFAGIALTGRRVAFVVDISGSMKLLDDKTPAPDKWATVTDTVARVMRSLPELEKFQVVVFSRDARYLFPGPDWQEYRGDATAARVADALKRVNPEGDTNVYDALDLAFRLKSAGLDTVYLFSDGLPTSGPGLTPEQLRSAPRAEQTDVLSRHLLRTLKGTWNRPDAGRRVRVNAVGFFFESPDVGAFLWALARDNDGSFVGMSRP